MRPQFLWWPMNQILYRLQWNFNSFPLSFFSYCLNVHIHTTINHNELWNVHLIHTCHCSWMTNVICSCHSIKFCISLYSMVNIAKKELGGKSTWMSNLLYYKLIVQRPVTIFTLSVYDNLFFSLTLLKVTTLRSERKRSVRRWLC